MKEVDSLSGTLFKCILAHKEKTFDQCFAEISPFLVKFEKELQIGKGTFFGGESPGMVFFKNKTDVFNKYYV